MVQNSKDRLEIIGCIDTKLDYPLKIVCDNGIPVQITYGKEDNFWIIYFSPPAKHSLQYFSTIPLVLDLKFTELQWEGSMQFLQEMEHKMAEQYPVTRVLDEDLENVLQSLNVVQSVCAKQSARQRAKTLLVEAFESLLLWVGPVLKIILYYIAFGLRMIINLLHVNLPVLKVSIFQISNTAKQLQLRLEQFLFWPVQYVEWFNSDSKLSPTEQAKYIGFFNTVWLIANDIILGLAVQRFLTENRFVISSSVETFLQKYTCDLVQEQIQWLLNWPGGLKLNAELATFLADLFQWMIFAWKEASAILIPKLPFMLMISGLFGTIGATFVLSMLSDLVSLFTLHLQLFYIISARIFNWVMIVLDSTFHLFRGKKRNPLRNRVDSAQYDLDQLLLGTVIFTVLVFLLPTIAVFYILFSLVVFVD